MDIFFFLTLTLVITFVGCFVYMGFLIIDIKHELKTAKRCLKSIKSDINTILENERWTR